MDDAMSSALDADGLEEETDLQVQQATTPSSLFSLLPRPAVFGLSVEWHHALSR